MYNSASNDYTSRFMFPKNGANKFSTSKFVSQKPSDVTHTQHMQHHKHLHHYGSFTEI